MGAARKDALTRAKAIAEARRLRARTQKARLASDAVLADARATVDWCEETLRRKNGLSRPTDTPDPGRKQTSEE